MTSLPNTDTQPAPSVYDQIGGEAAVAEAVRRFYVRVLDDPELQSVFEGIDMARLEAHQVALFTKLLGGPDSYSGRALAAAHQGLGITGSQYDLVVGHLVAVVTELGAAEVALPAMGPVLEAVRADVVEA
jgi:hemoglobin